MKSNITRVTLLTLIGLSLLNLASCKKDKSKQANCLLTGVKIVTPIGTTNTELFYDENNRIVNIEQTGFTANSLSLKYLQNTVLISATGKLKDSLTFNNAGYLLNHRFFTSNKSSWLNWAYQLNANNETVNFKLTTSQGTTVAEGPYTYVNGNLTQQETTTYIYDTSKPAQQGDYLSIGNILSLGIQKMTSKNLVTGFVSGGDTTKFNYAYDTQGRIIELLIPHGNTATYTKYKYSYDCNQ
jgi:hypothetical protein